MQELSDELEIDSGAEGTTVRLRVQLSGVGYAAARRA
jgi:hypothetical protein